jgi:hypothetical protein
MATALAPITIYQGDTKPIIITINTPAAAPDDITGDSFVWALYHDITGNALIKTVGNGLTISDVNPGQLVVGFVPADTMEIMPLTYKQMITKCVGGSRVLLATGYVMVEPNSILIEVS